LLDFYYSRASADITLGFAQGGRKMAGFTFWTKSADGKMKGSVPVNYIRGKLMQKQIEGVSQCARRHVCRTPLLPTAPGSNLR
jgi:hypothetical protein